MTSGKSAKREEFLKGFDAIIHLAQFPTILWEIVLKSNRRY